MALRFGWCCKIPWLDLVGEGGSLSVGCWFFGCMLDMNDGSSWVDSMWGMGSEFIAWFGGRRYI